MSATIVDQARSGSQCCRARSRREENSEDVVADVLARGGKGRVAAMQMVL